MWWLSQPKLIIIEHKEMKKHPQRAVHNVCPKYLFHKMVPHFLENQSPTIGYNRSLDWVDVNK